MAEQKYIKQLYEDGVSKSEIQRRTKLNYRTVCKYADKEDWNDERQPNLDLKRYGAVFLKFVISRKAPNDYHTRISGFIQGYGWTAAPYKR